jgi:hypothetical protein
MEGHLSLAFTKDRSLEVCVVTFEYLTYIALNAAYPEYKWTNRLRANGSKSQAALYNALRELLPNAVILQNYRLNPETEHIDTGLKFYELDVSLYL